MRPDCLVEYDDYKKRAIADAKALLEENGCMVLEWKTGIPKKNCHLIGEANSGVLRYVHVFYNNDGMFVEVNSGLYRDIKRWAYI